jgi:hypothetical protein
VEKKRGEDLVVRALLICDREALVRNDLLRVLKVDIRKRGGRGGNDVGEDGWFIYSGQGCNVL